MNNLLNEKNLFQNNFNKVSLKARFNLSYNLSDNNGPKPSSPLNELPIVKTNNLS